MDKFYFEIPTIERKQDAIEYMAEIFEENSTVNGVGGLDKFINDYEGWLKKLEKDYVAEPSDETVPMRTYFLVRKSDNRIVGMINIRLALNERLSKYEGNIGYNIRPSEREKGYNKINLYLGLKVCDKYGLDKILLGVRTNNPASWKTMEDLGGERIREFYNEERKSDVYNYSIDVKESLKTYKKEYEQYIDDDNELIRNINEY